MMETGHEDFRIAQKQFIEAAHVAIGARLPEAGAIAATLSLCQLFGPISPSRVRPEISGRRSPNVLPLFAKSSSRPLRARAQAVIPA
jgi:hypothetical protein